MDNLCHTLVGAAMAQSGLKRRTRLGTATLVIGANLPDVDILSILSGSALAFRRGWTHGILALVVLPLVLTGLMVVWGRWHGAGRSGAAPICPRQLFLLATLAVVSHTFLDWLNVYGVRLLMPFSHRWFYGDAVFIVDPWLWLVLAAGVGWGAFRERQGAARAGVPATAGLGLAALYIAGMLSLTQLGRLVVARGLGLGYLPSKGAVQVAPGFLNPIPRHVVFATEDRYWFGVIRWRPGPKLELPGDYLDRHLDDPRAEALRDNPQARQLLAWARFPYYVVERQPGTKARVLRLDDARYSTGGRSWAAVVTEIE